MLKKWNPELESDDEKIREDMLEYCYKRMNNEFPSITIHQVKRWLAYLEKVKDFDEQLEQAYKNSDEVQYKRGYDDGYVNGMANGMDVANLELEKQNVIKGGNSIDPHFGKPITTTDSIDPHFGKPIITDCGAKEKIQEKIIELSHKEDQEWNEDDEKNLQGVIDEIQANKSNAPEYDLKTYDRFLSWLKSIKERIQPQQKQGEWSEEDKEMRDLIDGISCHNDDVDYETHKKLLDWLLTLEQRLS